LAGSKIGLAAASLLANERLSAPAHFDAEVYSAFRRHFRQGLMSLPDLDRIVNRLVTLAVERVALPSLLGVAHSFADQLSAADAFYVALARLRRLELVTSDARLVSAAARLTQVRLVS